jgi:hypothetical protein
MPNRETRYRFPTYYDQVGPYLRFMDDNHICPSDVPWGSCFLVRDDNEIVIEVFDRSEGGYRILDVEGTSGHFRRRVESYHMVHHPDEYGIKPIGDGSIGVMV